MTCTGFSQHGPTDSMNFWVKFAVKDLVNVDLTITFKRSGYTAGIFHKTYV